MIAKHATRLALCASLAALTSACVIKGSSHGSHNTSSQLQSGDSKAIEAGGADQEASESEAAFRLKLAQLEYKRSQLEIKGQLSGAQFALETAQAELEDAQRALAAFAAEKQVKIDDAKLDLDRSIGSAHDAELELAELQAMYDEEDFAEKTKELVLSRGRRSLAHSKRRLAIAKEELRQLLEVELPGRQRELAWEVQAAQVSLEGAERDLAIAEMAAKIDSMQAKHDLEAARDGAEDKS